MNIFPLIVFAIFYCHMVAKKFFALLTEIEKFFAGLVKNIFTGVTRKPRVPYRMPAKTGR